MAYKTTKSVIIDFAIGFVGAAVLLVVVRLLGLDPTGHFGYTLYNQYLRWPLLALFLVGIMYFWRKRQALAFGIAIVLILEVIGSLVPVIIETPFVDDTLII